MKDNRLGAIALIIGAISGIITMTFHPGGVHHVTPAQFESLIAVIIGVHALAIAGLPFLFVGTLALSRELASPSRLAIMALVIYGFSLAAIMCAAAMSGLVTPDVLRHMTAHDAASEQWQALMLYTHTINQAFAQIGTVGSCLAIILWSLVIMKRSLLPLAIGVFGVIMGVAVIGALFTRAVNLEVHGFMLITFAQSIWFVLAGILLWQISSLPLDDSVNPAFTR